MNAKRKARVRRLLADLRHGETRGAALRRVRTKAAKVIRRRTGSAAGASKTPGGKRPAASVAKPRSDAWYVGQWTRLAEAVFAIDTAIEPRTVASTEAPEALKQARRSRAQAVFADTLANGEPLERAACLTAAALADLKDWDAWNEAWSIVEGVGRLPGGALASALGHAVILHRRRQFDRLWRRVEGLADGDLATFIPVEAVDAALAAGTAEARRRALAISVPTERMEADVLVDLAGRFLAFGERDRASELVAELRRRSPVELDDRRRHSWTVIEGWLDDRRLPVPAGAIPMAVIDYRTPDHILTSGNLGDYVQTLAMLGNLARLSDVTFSGHDGLGELATELQGRMRPPLRVPGVGGSIHLVAVDRDFSSAADVPESTWMIAFGWHMHPLYDLRYDFPYHRNIRPLFVSFHVNRLDMLTDEALAYLRRYGPVGCRDQTTVDLLLSADVDAFFSGCVTTTVDAVFPTRAEAYRGHGAVGVIDLARRAAGSDAKDVRVYGHQSDAYRYMSLTQGLRAASATLTEYQRDLERVVTRRLHAYLPLTALGVPVEFAPGGLGDVRFAGLTGLHPGDARLTGMQDEIRDLLAQTMATVLSGATEAEVYDRWRALTADRVTEAKAQFRAPVKDQPTTVDVAAAVAASRAGSRRFGPHDAVDRDAVSDIVLCFDQNLITQAPVMFESMAANAKGPLRLWVLGRGLTDAYQDWFAAAFPSIPITFFPCDHVGYGEIGRMPYRVTVSTMDRLLLPELLEDVDRVVYLDVDTLVLGDICQLVKIDLGGRPLGAHDSNVSETSEWRNAGRRLPELPARDLRRRMGFKHGYGHPALNAGVLVLDLDRLRRDGFTKSSLGLVEQYGLHDQDIMLAYAGPDRLVLEPRWNALSILEDVADPNVIHWASIGKPWDRPLTYEQDRWREVAARVAKRAGTPPSGDSAAGTESGPAGSLANPVEIGPAKGKASPKVERVITTVVDEHLSYLGKGPLRTLAACVAEIEAAGIPGLIVETGTARGGSAIVMAAAKAATRPMKIYDVFGMIPPPGERDGADVHERYATIASGESKGVGGETYYGYRDDLLTEVTASFARSGLPVAKNGIELIKGLFQDTVTLDEPVALAHLDGDWYESTMTCLTRIAPLLSVGGRFVIDDYDAWSGCRTAVDEYFADRTDFRFERRGRLHIVRVG